MARGLEQHQARAEAVSLLGKDLARRARSRCELCDGHEGALRPFEVPPVPEDPSLEHALLLCERCTAGALGEPVEAAQCHFLETAVWSELVPAQVTAVRLLRRLAGEGAGWAAQTLETVYLPPEVEAWAAQG